MMAVVQSQKHKVRPVLNYVDMNRNVSYHTGMEQRCKDSIRTWRSIGDNIAVIDLERAYLQIHVDRDLWKHQTVSFEGRYYALTRMGFGMTSSPKIMNAIVAYVLGLDEKVKRGVRSYVDDMVVDLNVITEAEVVSHLRKFGLVTKPQECIDKQRVLGLQLNGRERGMRVWVRPKMENLNLAPEMTRKDIFSLCGKLVGHYPIAGWLRLTCSMIKRSTNELKWNQTVNARTYEMMCEVMDEVKREDPVKGVWGVNRSGNVQIYTDASMTGSAVIVEVDGNVVEDACWIRKLDDMTHINVLELDVLIKGVHMAIDWKFKSFHYEL